MKKISILYLLLLLGLLTGCAAAGKKQEASYQIYYLDRNDNFILPLEYEVSTKEGELAARVEELLGQLAEPVSRVEYSPAISGFTVKGYELRKQQIILNLSEEYKLLPPIREVLTRAAIVKTLTQLEEIVYVTIQVNGENLVDSLGGAVGVMTADTFIDNTGEETKNYEETELILYFTNAAGDRLVKVSRKLMYNTNVSQEKLVVEQLIQGPVNQGSIEGIYPTLNPETKILSVNLKDGICYVNLDSNFLTSPNNVDADIVIYSLVNSLTELPNVLKVQIAIDGETEIKYQEKYELSTLFEENADMLKSSFVGE